MHPHNPIERKIIQTIDAHPHLDRRCLAVSEQDNVVTIAGVVENHDALVAVNGCAEKAAPHHRVINLATVSVNGVKAHTSKARMVKSAIETELPHADVDVAYLGPTVVLRGQANAREQRRATMIAAQTGGATALNAMRSV